MRLLMTLLLLKHGPHASIDSDLIDAGAPSKPIIA
jgi:hypothetical protein